MESGAVVTPTELRSSLFQTAMEALEEFSRNLELNILDQGLQWPFYGHVEQENQFPWQSHVFTGGEFHGQNSGAWPEASPGGGATGPSSPGEDGLAATGSVPSSNTKIAAKKKSKVVFSVAQLKSLSAHFTRRKYLSPAELRSVAADIGLTYQQVKRWFQNQRMKLKQQGGRSQWEAQRFSQHPCSPPPTPLGQFNGSYNLNCTGNCCFNPGDGNTWSFSGSSM